MCAYAALTVFACVRLPEQISDDGNEPAPATVSAPLTLPEDIQKQLDEQAADSKEAESAPEEALPPDTQPDENDQTNLVANDDEQPDLAADGDDQPVADAGEAGEESGYPSAHVVTKHAGSSVNIRAAATSDSEIVTTFYDGDAVEVLSVSGKWYQVQKAEVVGYIYQDYLSLDEED